MLLGLSIALAYIGNRHAIQNNGRLIAINKQLVAINKQQANDLKTTRKDIADLKSHLDCLFKIATTPHTTTNPPAVTDTKNCQLYVNGQYVAISSTTGASAPTGSPTSSVANNQSSPNNTHVVPKTVSDNPQPNQNAIQRVVGFFSKIVKAL